MSGEGGGGEAAEGVREVLLEGIRRRLVGLQKRISRLASRLSKDEELAARVEDDLKLLLEDLGKALPGKRPPRRRRGGGSDTPRGRPVPQPKAVTLEKSLVQNGGLRVKIDGGPPVVLAKRLAQFFEVLTSDSGMSKDGLLGWWSAAGVADVMRKKGVLFVKPRNVHQWTYRLRNTLAAAGYDWRLVQTDRRRGVRFALKRGGSSPMVTTASQVGQ